MASEQMERLRLVSVKLNKSTDDMNASITRLEDKLKDMNLGIQVMVQLEADPRERWLGYGHRTGGHGWGLYIRVGEEAWPYNNAPRALRIEAMNHLDRLLLKLEEEATMLSESCGKAVEHGLEVLKALGIES